jgi:hypothetical protein
MPGYSEVDPMFALEYMKKGGSKRSRKKKKGSKKDACYHKAKRKFKVFPSAYASGYIARCRKRRGKIK